MYTDINHLLTN